MDGGLQCFYADPRMFEGAFQLSIYALQDRVLGLLRYQDDPGCFKLASRPLKCLHEQHRSDDKYDEEHCGEEPAGKSR